MRWFLSVNRSLIIRPFKHILLISYVQHTTLTLARLYANSSSAIASRHHLRATPALCTVQTAAPNRDRLKAGKRDILYGALD